MTTIGYTDLPDHNDVHLLPKGYWTGLVVFGILWLVPVFILLATASR